MRELAALAAEREKPAKPPPDKPDKAAIEKLRQAVLKNAGISPEKTHRAIRPPPRFRRFSPLRYRNGRCFDAPIAVLGV
ncbi:hypothetical protein [Neisseria musculi]|uniref:hypothetical protein n=1 Tax=Neisseria musculi TaxID=1815583 RepID=UPI001FE44A68|nr:hypothetical protein [Neisseria musculi]